MTVSPETFLAFQSMLQINLSWREPTIRLSIAVLLSLKMTSNVINGLHKRSKFSLKNLHVEQKLEITKKGRREYSPEKGCSTLTPLSRGGPRYNFLRFRHLRIFRAILYALAQFTYYARRGRISFLFFDWNECGNHNRAGEGERVICKKSSPFVRRGAQKFRGENEAGCERRKMRRVSTNERRKVEAKLKVGNEKYKRA